KKAFLTTMPKLINYNNNPVIAGGGVWPEPYVFDPKTKRRSFFWGKDLNGYLKYYDDYNKPGPGYHNEEWYVPLRYMKPGKVFWSKSYMDPYSYQPMVTCTTGIYKNNKFMGTITIDLKLEGMQAFANALQKKTGGYIFILDRNNKFITFPNTKLVKKIGKDEKGKRTEDFMLSSELAKIKPLFLPISKALNKMNQDVLAKAEAIPDFRSIISEKIDKDSYQINQSEAKLISAIITDPLAKSTEITSLYQNFEISDDFINKKHSLVYIFHVPESYWKLVVVKPFSEAIVVANNISSDIILSLEKYVAISVLLIIIIAYILFNYYIRKPIAGLTASINTMSTLVEDGKTSEVKEHKTISTGLNEYRAL
ncbi:MAG: cache domain-containing protein, partial [Spirochaetota bacterium]|nr:cache domain-containing protein [Spirochaetota bacterium]